eukprot:GHVN01044169.1.p1 GENE.GHVN01044169.1~~GHVN01044169.1.p1  ORF type:complete len:181 (+),score=31.78 GHVN01044169.1:710-1252(+)
MQIIQLLPSSTLSLSRTNLQGPIASNTHVSIPEPTRDEVAMGDLLSIYGVGHDLTDDSMFGLSPASMLQLEASPEETKGTKEKKKKKKGILKKMKDKIVDPNKTKGKAAGSTLEFDDWQGFQENPDSLYQTIFAKRPELAMNTQTFTSPKDRKWEMAAAPRRDRTRQACSLGLNLPGTST